jgi:glycerophosphoryl diester phosphodiesterase
LGKLSSAPLLQAFCLCCILIFAQSARAQDRADLIRRKLDDPRGGVFVVAHRGCHNPVPAQGLPAVPENSLAALEKCVTLGVDMMETDIRRSKDGVLVIMHDPTVDRTTNGSGRVADLTWAQLKVLRLRQNFGGLMAPQLTDQHVSSLDELLAAAKGRIMINLDIKEAIYPQVIAAAVRDGVADQVVVKSVVDTEEPPLADRQPYAQVPYMPILFSHPGRDPGELAKIAAVQVSGARRPPAIELVFLDQPQFEAVRALARKADVRLWDNTLTGVGVVSVFELGGDIDALRDPAAWGRWIDQGVTVFQTDEPAPLLDYLKAHPAATQAAAGSAP